MKTKTRLPDSTQRRAKYRYVTPALRGGWRHTRREGLMDALDAGQAHCLRADTSKIELAEFARIEEDERGVSFVRGVS